MFTATISHHSISRAPIIQAGKTLLAAKRAATRRFGDGFLDHMIGIYDQDGNLVSVRRIADRRWIDRY